MRTRRLLATTTAALSLLLSKNLLSSPPPPDLLDAAPSRFATSDGAKVHYKSLGDPAAKTAVVFIHGFSCDMTSWRAQAPAFDGKARMLFVDLPGHGKSDRPAVDYTMDRFARPSTRSCATRASSARSSWATAWARPSRGSSGGGTRRRLSGSQPWTGPCGRTSRIRRRSTQFVARFSGPDYAKTMTGFFESTFTPSTPETVKADVRKMAAGLPQHGRRERDEGHVRPRDLDGRCRSRCRSSFSSRRARCGARTTSPT